MNAYDKASFAFCAAIAMTMGVAAPAAAQTMRTEGPPPSDPVMQMADWMLPHNEFALNSDRNVELIRYKTVRDIEICIARPDPNSVFGARTAVPVQVQWDNDTGMIWPGNCLSFDAKQVEVKAAEPLPDDTELLGTFRVIH